MCEVMTALAGVAALASTAISIADQNAKAAYATNALRRNQMLAGQQAGDAIVRGRAAEGMARMRGGQVVGAQRAAYAASGVDVGVGSPVDVAASTRAFAELDAQTARNNAMREAWGYQQQGMQFGEQAAQVANAQGAATAGTLLGGAGQLAGAFGQGIRRMDAPAAKAYVPSDSPMAQAGGVDMGLLYRPLRISGG